MTKLMMLILLFSGNLMPDSVKTFTAQTGGQKMVFVEQKDDFWLCTLYNADGSVDKTLGNFKVDGLKVTQKEEGASATVDMGDMLGLPSTDELKTTTKVKMRNRVYEITKEEKGFSIKTAGKPSTKVTW